MPTTTTNIKTTLAPDEVLTRAVQFFSTEKWKPTSQSPRTATFEGKVPIPWGMLCLMVLSFMCFVIPGIILYVLIIKKLRGFQNLVIAVTAIPQGTEVSVSHPPQAKALVAKFMKVLPEVTAP